MNHQYDPRESACEALVNKLGYESLDANIRYAEQQIHSLEVSLREAKSRLAELQKVRKLVTPEDEGKIRALREVGLI